MGTINLQDKLITMVIDSISDNVDFKMVDDGLIFETGLAWSMNTNCNEWEECFIYNRDTNEKVDISMKQNIELLELLKSR